MDLSILVAHRIVDVDNSATWHRAGPFGALVRSVRRDKCIGSMQIILTVRDNSAVISYRASRYLRSAINEEYFDHRNAF